MNARTVSSLTASAVALALLVLTTGCGSENTTSGTESSGSTTTQSTSSTEQSSQVVSVRFARSGGLKPTATEVVYAADAKPPVGTTRADVQAVLQAASDPQLQDLQLTKLPPNTCCDRYAFEVTITWADGTAKTYRTVEGVQQPAAFEHLLSLLSQASPVIMR